MYDLIASVCYAPETTRRRLAGPSLDFLLSLALVEVERLAMNVMSQLPAWPYLLTAMPVICICL